MGEIEQKELKNYKKQLEILKERKKVVDGKAKKIMFEQQEIENKINNLQVFIDSLKEKKIEMSLHAWVRYFERILKYNLEELEQDIITKEIQERHKTLGDGNYKNNDMQLVIMNNKIVTILKGEK